MQAKQALEPVPFVVSGVVHCVQAMGGVFVLLVDKKYETGQDSQTVLPVEPVYVPFRHKSHSV